jgi:hypothetical protein
VLCVQVDFVLVAVEAELDSSVSLGTVEIVDQLDDGVSCHGVEPPIVSNELSNQRTGTSSVTSAITKRSELCTDCGGLRAEPGLVGPAGSDRTLMILFTRQAVPIG